ncbi:hypothetical protein [Intrasporangium chromatireducens]|nr:hypothetical protein [Intrasporangium chromatireducens]
MLASECEHVRLFAQIFEALDWRLVRTDGLPDDMTGLAHWGQRIVWLDHELRGPYARFVLEHELQHVLRGPVLGTGPSAILAEELECDRLATEAMRAAGYDVDPEWLVYGGRASGGEGWSPPLVL